MTSRDLAFMLLGAFCLSLGIGIALLVNILFLK